jgi:very-short-patch-repair endonuclease
MKIRKHIDEEELKRLYLSGKSLKDIGKYYGLYYETISARLKHLGVPIRTKHTEQSKTKISELRKRFLSENPDKHPWRSHNKFKSVPCETLKTWLRSLNTQFEEEFLAAISIGKNYSVDIAFPDKFIGIEVNGNQHYNRDGTLKPYYEKRKTEIEKLGWKLYQLHYSLCYKPASISQILTEISDAKEIKKFDYTAHKYIV